MRDEKREIRELEKLNEQEREKDLYICVERV